MVKTFEQVLEFNEYANKIKDKQNKLSYACKKVQKRLAEYIEDYVDKIKDLDIEFASVDDKGNLVIHNDRYTYKPDKLRTLNEAKKKLWKENKDKEYEFESYICSELPELTQEELDILEGFVL